jgi:signal transduction histidine kinase
VITHFLKNRSLNQLNFLGLLGAGFFISIFTIILAYQEYNQYQDEIQEIETNYILSQKNIIKRDTQRALRYIAYKHNQNPHKPLSSLQEEIVDAIEQMRDDHEGSGYVFIYTFEGINIADPILKHNSGKNLIDFKDPTGKKVIKELIDVSRHPNGGYVDYVWNKPLTHTLAPKISYAKSYEPFGWMVGSGVYIDDITKVLEEKKIAYQHRMIDLGVKILILVGVIILALSIFSSWLSWMIRHDFDQLLGFFNKAISQKTSMDKDTLTLSEFQAISSHATLMSEIINSQKEELESINASLEARVVEKTKKLTIALNAQDRFVKNAIHEINTPLAIIQTNIDLLRGAGYTTPHMRKIEAAIAILTGIYADLSYYIKKDRFLAQKKGVNLSHFLIARVDYFSDIFTQNSLEFSVDIASDLMINFDPIQLGRICDNTLFNALKYGVTRSEVNVSLRYHEGLIRMSVSNYCYAPFDPTKIFDRYYREDESKGGFGVGLSLVAQICNENGVTYGASCENLYATFWYDFEDILSLDVT